MYVRMDIFINLNEILGVIALKTEHTYRETAARLNGNHEMSFLI
jgi:hypothetical protein